MYNSVINYIIPKLITNYFLVELVINCLDQINNEI